MEKKTKLMVNLGASGGSGGGGSSGTKLYRHIVVVNVTSFYGLTNVSGINPKIYFEFINEVETPYSSLSNIISDLYNIYGTYQFNVNLNVATDFTDTNSKKVAFLKSYINLSSTSSLRKLNVIYLVNTDNDLTPISLSGSNITTSTVTDTVKSFN